MDAKASESGHLMLITPERVFYAGLLGRPRERCPGALHIYVAIKGGLWLSTSDSGDRHGELLACCRTSGTPLRASIARRSASWSSPKAFVRVRSRNWQSGLSGPQAEIFAARIRAAYSLLRERRDGDDITSAEFDIMCLGEALPRRTIDPRVERAFVQIGKFSGEPVTAASCATEAGLSSSRFLHLFKEETGILVPLVPRLEARAASAALRQPGHQPRASRAGYRLSRLHPFQPFDPPLLWPEAARDLLRLPRSRDLP